MKRFHVHVRVDDLAKSVALYSRLFAAESATLKRRIELMLSLPIASLDTMSLQRSVREIEQR